MDIGVHLFGIADDEFYIKFEVFLLGAINVMMGSNSHFLIIHVLTELAFADLQASFRTEYRFP